MASNRCLGRLLDGRVVDTSPMGGGNNALSLDGGSWHPFLGTFGDLIEATRLSDKEAEEILRNNPRTS